jgi:transcriptional regulator GlxA family with amidase domain
MAAQRLNDLARLRRVRDQMDRQYAQPLDVPALARQAGLPAGDLHRQFQLAYGQSPYAYLVTRRVQRAVALLRGGDHTFAEARCAVGRTSPGTSESRLTELAGMVPSTYDVHAADTAAQRRSANFRITP